MSDLISRKKISGYIKMIINPYGKPFEGTAYELGLKIMRYIDAMESAYDVDKVVEELELHSFELGTDTLPAHYVRLNDAIEIVKQGGVSDVSDDVCEWIKYDYRTICPKNHDVNNSYWRIPDNMDKLKYCPYCGKKIKIVGD